MAANISISKNKWYVRLFMWAWGFDESDTIDLCRLFWGVLFFPLGRFFSGSLSRAHLWGAFIVLPHAALAVAIQPSHDLIAKIIVFVPACLAVFVMAADIGEAVDFCGDRLKKLARGKAILGKISIFMGYALDKFLSIGDIALKPFIAIFRPLFRYFKRKGKVPKTCDKIINMIKGFKSRHCKIIHLY